jgi:hypothetical protein
LGVEGDRIPQKNRQTSYGGIGSSIVKAAMSSEFTLKDLVGVWRRRSIETEDGQKDTTTQVFWLQTHACFGDIRIPLLRPPGLGDRSLQELSGLEAIALSGQQGFGGVTQVEGSTCQWHRRIDYQPPNGSRDIGLLEWEQNILIESGVDAAYREEWERIDDGSIGCCALVLEPEEPSTAALPWQGCVVSVGDYFVQILDRRPVLPQADSLKALLESAPDRQQQQGYLDCEISFGRRSSGQIPWEIELSTFPWREGQPLWALADLKVDLEQKCMIQTLPHDPHQVRRWKIWEWGLEFKV